MSSLFDDIENFSSGIDFKKKMGMAKEPADVTLIEERKRMKPSERLLADIESKGFNMSQMSTVIKQTGNQLVVSCAGSGKTTALVFKIMYDIKTGYATRIIESQTAGPMRVVGKIWVSTFLKTGAEELQADFRRWCSRLGQRDVTDAIQFSTLHAEFKRALTQYGSNCGIIKASKNSSLLKEVVGKYALKNANGFYLNSEDYNKLEGALAYTRNRLDEDRYNKDIYQDLGITAPIIDAILSEWKSKRVEAGEMDFDDLQELIYEQCCVKRNADFINYIRNRYDYIYIDEFQDISQIQYEILKIYAIGSKQVFAIGDDDQTIYTWRGSDNKIITDKFPEDFSPVVNKLSINYRCPSVILDAIKPSIALNENRYEKELNSFNEGGQLRIIEENNYSRMCEKLVECVCADLNKGLSVAVLCRVNVDGLMPALMFDRLGKFSYSIANEGMTLDSYIGRLAVSIVKLFTERCTPAVKKALSSLTYDSRGVSKLLDVCKSNRTSIWSIPAVDLSYSCPDIANILLDWRGVKQSKGNVEALKYVLSFYRRRVFVKDSQFNDVVRSTIMALEQLLEYSRYDNVEDFLYDLDDMGERMKGRLNVRSSFVKIVTVHEYKGKEADSVYVWNDSTDVFPNRKATTEVELEEERRIHYIACTRAKKMCTLVYRGSDKGKFIYEMDLSNADYLDVQGSIMGLVGKNVEENANLRRFMQQGSNSGSGSRGISDEDILGSDFVEEEGEVEESLKEGESSFKKVNRVSESSTVGNSKGNIEDSRWGFDDPPVLPGVNAPAFDDNEFWGME